MLAFTINAAVGPITMILGGFLTDRGLAKWTITFGGLLFALGFFLTGFVESPGMLYLTYGVLSGLGQGFAYSACLSNTIRLFPDKRGLASGLITAGMGGAAIIAAPIANAIIESRDVLTAFRFIGIAYMIVVVMASFFIKKPLQIIVQQDGSQTSAVKGTAANYSWQEMMKTPAFI